MIIRVYCVFLRELAFKLTITLAFDQPAFAVAPLLPCEDPQSHCQVLHPRLSPPPPPPRLSHPHPPRSHFPPLLKQTRPVKSRKVARNKEVGGYKVIDLPKNVTFTFQAWVLELVIVPKGLDLRSAI